MASVYTSYSVQELPNPGYVQNAPKKTRIIRLPSPPPADLDFTVTPDVLSRLSLLVRGC
jgi:hypothetical protein